jgi:GNAT superfamily N-acetyltransferase
VSVTVELREEPYDGPVAQSLIEAVQREYVDRYGGRDDTPVDPAQFTPPQGMFLVGYLNGLPVATGGFRRHESGALEIKRMYVVPEARGNGLSRVMLAAIEDRARALGATRIILETGDKQPEAVSLYESSDYQRIAGFGHYAESETSISFEKKL